MKRALSPWSARRANTARGAMPSSRNGVTSMGTSAVLELLFQIDQSAFELIERVQHPVLVPPGGQAERAPALRDGAMGGRSRLHRHRDGRPARLQQDRAPQRPVEHAGGGRLPGVETLLPHGPHNRTSWVTRATEMEHCGF